MFNATSYAGTSYTATLWNFEPQIITLILATIIVLIMLFTYYIKQLKYKDPSVARKGFVLMMDNFFLYVEDLVVDVMGPNFRWFTPYLIYLFLYVGIGNLLSVLGWEGTLSSYTIALSLGMVTFIGTYIAGLYYHKFKFFKKFLINPLELLSQFGPLISITFRIFGNLTAGGAILTLFYIFTTNLSSKVPVLSEINLLGGLVSPVLHLYFDIFDGLIQTFIFGLLTISYIGMEAEVDEQHKPKYGRKSIKIKSIDLIYEDGLDLVRVRN